MRGLRVENMSETLGLGAAASLLRARDVQGSTYELGPRLQGSQTYVGLIVGSGTQSTWSPRSVGKGECVCHEQEACGQSG